MGRTKHAPRPEALVPPIRRTRLIDKKWLTIDAVAPLLMLSPTRVTELVKAGHLESSQASPGSRIRVSEESVEAYLRRGHREARAS